MFQEINFALFKKKASLIKISFISFFPSVVSYGPFQAPRHPHPNPRKRKKKKKSPAQANPRTYASILRIWSPVPFQLLLSPALNPKDVALMESHTKAQKCLHAAFSQHLKAVICCNWDNREFSLSLAVVVVFFFPLHFLPLRFDFLPSFATE